MAAVIKVKPTILGNGICIILDHDSGLLHFDKQTLQNLKVLKREFFYHSLYFPDLDPSDFHFFLVITM